MEGGFSNEIKTKIKYIIIGGYDNHQFYLILVLNLIGNPPRSGFTISGNTINVILFISEFARISHFKKVGHILMMRMTSPSGIQL